MDIHFTLNGEPVRWEVAPGETLLEALRAHSFYGVKDGCSTGDCGACAVIVDGNPRNSCVMFAFQVQGRTVLTIEGIGNPDKLHPIQQAFLDLGAAQCGYCTPGMIVTAKALLDRVPDPTPDQIREALSSTLCRCTGYVKPAEAVMQAAKVLKGDGHGAKNPR
ncbi:MAG: (2Fe-2S)-binding protein [Armatimonadetes bacterium]|nr:(2Fe-2S)-binding protein [Armatimonadota bacterium]